jgi:hypothetical protein
MAHRTRRELDGRFTAVLIRQVAMPQPQFILLIEPDVTGIRVPGSRTRCYSEGSP